MEETENSKLMETAHCEVEECIEKWDEQELDDDALLDQMSARAVAWCQAIAEFVMPMDPNDTVLTTLNYDREGIVITVRRGGPDAAH